MKTIRELFELEEVVPKASTKSIPLNNPDPSLLYGLELEIEYANPDWANTWFRVTEDRSLRNEGYEFISKPMSYSHMVYALNKFFEKADIKNNAYSERTSTHVHTNCQDLDFTQLKSILILYQIFEDLLFNWVGHDRQQNIFCVPWSQTQITANSLIDIEFFVSMSSVERNKYTALNLVPLKSQGTIEWRHLYGTSNIDIITTWMKLIGHIYRIARQYDYGTILHRCLNLNTSSQYEFIIEWVFEELTKELKCKNYMQILENGVLTLKYSMLPKKNLLKPENLNARLQDYIRTYIEPGQERN